MDDINRPMKRSLLIVMVASACALYLASLLVGPRVSDQSIAQDRLWLENVRFSEHLGVSLNKDSFFYLAGTTDTRTVFQPFAIIQSRPLLAFLLKPVSDLLRLLPLGPLPGASAAFNALLPAYLAYLLFNLSAVIATFWLYTRLTISPARGGEFPATFLIGTALVANEVTKAFFFAAHTQMLNLLVPMIALYVLRAFSAGTCRRRVCLYAAALTGLMMLAYGSAIIVGAAIGMAWIRRAVSARQPLGRTCVELVAIAVLIVLPYLLWRSFVLETTGQFYSHEIERWRQVVWMFDVVEKGWPWLLASLAGNLFFLLMAVLKHLAPLAPVMALLAWLSWRHRDVLGPAMRPAVTHLMEAAVIAAIFVVFFALVGYNVTRLAMPAAALCIVMTGLWCHRVESVLPGTDRKVLTPVVSAVMAVQAVWMVAKDGPYL